MNIKIGEKIKSLRKKAEVTQERFAEYLGITPQAVSRWESETAYPDIEIIPSIANFFNVTTDELLGVNANKAKERIKKIEELINENFMKGLIDKAIEICRNAIAEFPNNYKLISWLAFALHRKSGDVKEENEKKKYLIEMIELRERILEDCIDDGLRFSSLQQLSYAYNEMGNKEKSIEIANKLPFFYNTSNVVRWGILDGEERLNQIKENIGLLWDLLTEHIGSIARLKYKNDSNSVDVNIRIELYKKMIIIIETILEKGDYAFAYLRMDEYYSWIAEDYILLKDYEKALDYLEKSAKNAIMFDNLPEMFFHTSIIYEGDKYEKNKHTAIKAINCKKDVLESNELYKPIRENPRFKAIVAELEKYAKKED